MKILGYELRAPWRRASEKQAPFESALMRLVAAQEGYWAGGFGAGYFGSGSGAFVNPENCMMSPTVHAIVTAVSRRISISPVHVYQKTYLGTGREPDPAESTESRGRERRQHLPNHPVDGLLAAPNRWQSSVNYWQDAVSRYLRYGNFYAYKSRGQTGPIRELIPVHPRQFHIQQDLQTWAVSYRINGEEVPLNRVHHVRGPSRNGFVGDSPVMDCNAAIALEIAAEQFGASFFTNGALPLMIFKYMMGTSGFKDPEAEKQFIDDFQNAFSGNKRHRALLLPKGIDTVDPIKIENDKAQMLETRKYQRSVIAGAFGVPPHLVGDLERATYNNVEQQDEDFKVNVVLPVARCFESAMERDLLTASDRANGVIIRFDLDAVLRADFKSRQEGRKIQREAGIICPNDWLEGEGMNPISPEDGGEDYIRPLNYVVVGAAPGEPGGPPLPQAGGSGEPVKPNGSGGTRNGAEPSAKMLAAMLAELHELKRLASDHEREPPQHIVLAPHFEFEFKQAGSLFQIGGATITIKEPAIELHAPVSVAPHTVRVESPTIEIAPPALNVKIDAPVSVMPQPVHVEGPVVEVAPNINIKNEQPQVTVLPTSVKVESPVEVSPNINIRNEQPDVTVLPTSVKVDAPVEVSPNINIKNEQPSVTVMPQSVRVDGTSVELSPNINIRNEPPEVKVLNQTEVTPPDVHVHPPQVKVEAFIEQPEAPDVHVHPAVVTVENRIDSPGVKVENYIEAPEAPPPPDVNVHVGGTTIEAPVHVEPTTTVTVEPVQLVVQPPDIKVDVAPAEVHVAAPEVTVQPPEVYVAAPNVTVRNEAPEYEVVEAEAQRDDKGAIQKVITTKRRTNKGK